MPAAIEPAKLFTRRCPFSTVSAKFDVCITCILTETAKGDLDSDKTRLPHSMPVLPVPRSHIVNVLLDLLFHTIMELHLRTALMHGFKELLNAIRAVLLQHLINDKLHA